MERNLNALNSREGRGFNKWIENSDCFVPGSWAAEKQVCNRQGTLLNQEETRFTYTDHRAGTMDWILTEPLGREGQFSPTGCLSTAQLHVDLGWKAEYEDSHRMKIGKQERKSEGILIIIYH